MKLIKKSLPATWLKGGALSLTAVTSTDAGIVVHTLNHDLSSTLDGETIFPGSVSDEGQWNFANTSPSFAFLDFRTLVGADPGSGADIGYADGFAAVSSYRGAAPFGLGSVSPPSGDDIAGRGYLMWDITGGIEGWLRVEFDSAAQTGLIATGFLYDDASSTRPSDLSALQAEGGNVFISSTSPVPEPTSLFLLAAGAGGVMLRRKRKHHAS